jgi:hypothetical protein
VETILSASADNEMAAKMRLKFCFKLGLDKKSP